MHSNKRPKHYYVGNFRFSEPAPLSTKACLPLPGVFALYLRNPSTGMMKLRYVGAVENLEKELTFLHPVVQKVHQEAKGNKELIFYALHIEKDPQQKQVVIRDITSRYQPFHNLLLESTSAAADALKQHQEFKQHQEETSMNSQENAQILSQIL
jgi:hypothetical protein